MKFLLVLLVLAIAYHLWQKSRQRARAAERAQAQARTPAPGPTPAPPQEMIACTHCQLHIPRGEALAHAGRYYCCAAHRDQHAP